jgi:hypothetical protein
MASQWYSLVSQKLFLAKTLLDLAEHSGSEPHHGQLARETELTLKSEAALQGCIELLLRSRKLLLVMIARFYQKQSDNPGSLDQLAVVIGEGANEVRSLRALEGHADSWWSHLVQLEQAQSCPPVARKTVSKENIIAISADDAPDRSTKSLQQTLTAMKHFAESLEEQHGEW